MKKFKNLKDCWTKYYKFTQLRKLVFGSILLVSFSSILNYDAVGRDLFNVNFNHHTPVAQKIADEVVFRRFQGERVEFFSIGPH